jgi:DNA-binding winged helix-turn-helix (wHTH) protein
MPEGKRLILAFGPFRLFPSERRLENEGKPVRIGGRALDLLIVLVERAGEVVSNRALLEKVWQDVSVEQSSLRFCIKNLRKALGDNQRGKQYVANVPGRGYSFVASAERVDNMVASLEGDMKLIARANLPSRESMIVGRSGSVETVCRELSKRRLVTVTGPGGIGKTSLAVVAAQALRSNYNNSVLFVDLAPIEDPSLVVSSLASALGVALRVDEPIPAILDFLRDQPLLIVLDNCEQVVEAVASLAEHILSGTVDTHLLVTSREPLRIRGEHLHRLLPLECPPNNDATTDTAHVGAMQRQRRQEKHQQQIRIQHQVRHSRRDG